MISIRTVTSTRCFVKQGEGLAQVVWLDLASAVATRAEAWAEGAGLACTAHWEGTLAADVTARVDIAVRPPAEAAAGTIVPFEAVVRAADGVEVRQTGELVVAEPGWVMYMVPHFHYDPVWWNTQAGHLSGWDELLWAQVYRRRYEHTGLVLVEAHLERARLDPAYKFVLSEVDYLKPFWDLYPDRRQELRQLLAEDRLEIVGGTYNEPNTNLVGMETAVRSAVYGMGFQRDVLGASPESAWPLDVEAHDPSFPGIMAECGLTSSAWARGPFHQYGPKFHTGATTWMQFPTEFEWVAPNGKGLLTSYMPIHYAAGWDLDQASTLDEAMTRAYDLFCDLAPVAATKVTLLPVGTDYTPPNKWVTQLARAWAARYRWPRFVVGLPKEFFAAVRAELAEKAKSPAPQTREMGPVYTGKDVSYIDIKQAHRRAESALVEGEKLASMALALGHRYPGRAADKAWRQLVYNAHHDGVTGTGSDQVYLDLLGGWREAWQLANDIRTAAMGDVASHIATAAGPCEGMATPPAAAQACVVFNSLSFARQGTVTVELGPPVTGAGAVVVRDEAGTEVPALSSVSRRHPDGTASSFTVQFQAPDVPGLGYRCFWVEPVPAAPKGWEPMQGTVAANERFLVEADPLRGGCLSRALDRASGREILAGSGLGNELLMYPEYPGHPWMMADHPDMAEGPWHLLPAGAPVSASERTARVVAERSALGQRLVVTGNLAGTVYTQTIALLAGSNRVDLRTCLHGFSGHDRLLRLRFATAVQGGRPLAEVAGSVIARSFALIDADAAEAPWTMDGPAQGWCGVGTTLSVHVRDTDPSKPTTDWPLGVGEVVVPTGAAGNHETRALLVALVGKGVTASCTEAGANRYGALAGDSNLPDFRVSIGRPEENELTAAVLRSAGPGFQAELDRQLAAHGWARVWAPPTRPLAEVWAPNADLRHARDLPVLVLAGRDAASTAAAVTALADEVDREHVVVEQPWELTAGFGAPGGAGGAADWAVGLFNRGTPGFAVDTAGALYVSLLRSCSGFPAGVWIDPPRRAAPDGSSFQAQHWSHVFEHALTTGEGDWRSADFVMGAQEFNTPLLGWLEPLHDGDLAVRGSLLDLVNTGPGQVVVSAVKPAGNPLACGRMDEASDHAGAGAGHGQPAPTEGAGAGEIFLTARLYETSGRPAKAVLRPGLDLSLVGASSTNPLEDPSGPLDCPGGELALDFANFGLRTVRLALQRRGGMTVPGTGPGTSPRARRRTGARISSAPVPAVEAAQPVFTRYWLHNKGPAPMGNQPLAVHVSPAWAGVRAGDEPVPLTVTVASDLPATGQHGMLEILAPEGWRTDPVVMPFEIAGGAHARVPVRFMPSAQATPGRYFIAARVTDSAGQVEEDVVTVDLWPWHPLGDYGQGAHNTMASLGPEGGFRHPGAQAATEVEVTLAPGPLVMVPGGDAALELTVTNRTRSAVRGEAQLVSPVETWSLVGPWSQGFTAEPGQPATVRFWARAPGDAGALSSWLLVKVMYFGRLWYSPSVRFEIAPFGGDPEPTS